MARVLIAWELGEAFGHLARCLRLANGLCQRGHTVVLALKHVRLPAGQTLTSGITVLPVPLTPPGVVDRNPPVNYADILRISGFADAQDVAARLNAWRGIFTLARPDVLVADHAPTALLAARLDRIPHLTIGNGFAIPPAIRPWPSIRSLDEVAETVLTTAEARLDRVTEAAQQALGCKTTVRVRELFGTHDILDTFAELDHYGARPSGCYVGPIVSVPKALHVAWQSRQGPKVLAYLRPTVPGFAAILQALAQLDAEVLCVTPGMKPEAAQGHATRRLRIALVPVDLPQLLEHADLAVGYGNCGFSTQALLAGVPLAMSPRYVEQALLVRRVEALGAGRQFDSRINTDSAKSTLQTLLNDPLYRQAARAFKDRHHQFSSARAIEQSLSLIERALHDGLSANPNRHAQETQEKPPACLH